MWGQKCDMQVLSERLRSLGDIGGRGCWVFVWHVFDLRCGCCRGQHQKMWWLWLRHCSALGAMCSMGIRKLLVCSALPDVVVFGVHGLGLVFSRIGFVGCC